MKAFRILGSLALGLSFLAGPASADVTCEETDAGITVAVDGRNVLTYHKATNQAPQGIDADYARSAYIHPVLNPDGQELTGDFPADHPHQHALFFAWRQVAVEGRQTDFWDQKTARGRTTHQKTLAVYDGKTKGGFAVEIHQQDLTGPDGPLTILVETWKITVHDRTESKDDPGEYFVFDLKQVQTSPLGTPITVEKYHYGGMALRGHDQWLLTEKDSAALKAWEKQHKKDPQAPRPELSRSADFLTSEGKGRDTGNHSRPNWVDVFGDIDGKPAGIAVLAHPTNFRHPQPVRLHPSKPYFSFSPMVLGDFEIGPGESYTGNYRYIAHNGAPDAAFLDAEWKAYAETEP